MSVTYTSSQTRIFISIWLTSQSRPPTPCPLASALPPPIHSDHSAASSLPLPVDSRPRPRPPLPRVCRRDPLLYLRQHLPLSLGEATSSSLLVPPSTGAPPTPSLLRVRPPPSVSLLSSLSLLTPTGHCSRFTPSSTTSSSPTLGGGW
jgi:hypothetical protein